MVINVFMRQYFIILFTVFDGDMTKRYLEKTKERYQAAIKNYQTRKLTLLDAIAEKFPGRTFRMRTPESTVKNILLTFQGFFSYQQVDQLFELLNKVVDVIYQYCSRCTRFFCRNYYPYIKFLSGTHCKYYHIVILKYHQPVRFYGR